MPRLCAALYLHLGDERWWYIAAPEKDGLVLFFLNKQDNAVFARRLGVSFQTLCRLYRGTERMSRSVRRKALSILGVTEDEFSFLVSKVA